MPSTRVAVGTEVALTPTSQFPSHRSVVQIDFQHLNKDDKIVCNSGPFIVVDGVEARFETRTGKGADYGSTYMTIGLVPEVLQSIISQVNDTSFPNPGVQEQSTSTDHRTDIRVGLKQCAHAQVRNGGEVSSIAITQLCKLHSSI